MTFRSAYDCLPEDIKTKFTQKAARTNVFSVHVFRDDEQGADVVAADISGPEALRVLQEAIADSKVMSAFATRERGDGTSQILYLVELEERFPMVDA